MSEWRTKCRACDEPVVPERAWCKECLKRIAYWGVVDRRDDMTHKDARKAGVYTSRALKA